MLIVASLGMAVTRNKSKVGKSSKNSLKKVNQVKYKIK